MTNDDIAKYVNTYCIPFGTFAEAEDYKFVAKYIEKSKNRPIFLLIKYDPILKKEEFKSAYASYKIEGLNFI